MIRVLSPGRLIAKPPITTSGDTTPGGVSDVLLLSDGSSGLKLADNSSFLKLASSS